MNEIGLYTSKTLDRRMDTTLDMNEFRCQDILHVSHQNDKCFPFELLVSHCHFICFISSIFYIKAWTICRLHTINMGGSNLEHNDYKKHYKMFGIGVWP